MATEANPLSGANFAVICSFLQELGEILGVEQIAFDDLQHYLEDTKKGKPVFQAYLLQIKNTIVIK